VPGIFGIVDHDASPAGVRAAAGRIGAALADQPALRVELDVAASGPAVLGRTHLGVVDETIAPAVAAGGAVRVVVAGEVTSVPGGAAALAARYASRGDAALHGLSGSFAAAVWDARGRRLHLVSDRFGLRNVYWTRRGDALLFAPRVAALLAEGRLGPRLDADAAAEFALFQCVLGDHTLLAGVFLLPPATLLTFTPGAGVRLERTWRLRYRAVRGRPADHAAALADALRSTVARQAAGVRAGLPLSGGLDSRTLLAAATAERLRLPTLTYGRPGCDDVLLAATLASATGMPHHAIPLRPGYVAAEAHAMVALTDGMHSCLNAHAAVLRDAAAVCDLIVLGNGGDCLLDGLWTGPPDAPDEDVLARLFARIRLGLTADVVPRVVARDGALAAVEARARAGLRRALAGVDGDSIADRVDAFNVVERHRRWVMQGVPAQATHVEFRHPYYADPVVDVALGVPAALRAERRAHAAALRRLAPTLAAIRRDGKPFGFAASDWRRRVDHVTVRLRGAVRWRANRFGLNVLATRPSRRGFTDVGDELRHGSRSLLREVLLAPACLERGWWEPDAVRTLVVEHASGRANHAVALGIVLTLELFAGRTFDVAHAVATEPLVPLAAGAAAGCSA
jgi:asparagine synthase (glutamine-hydrolysing)